MTSAQPVGGGGGGLRYVVVQEGSNFITRILQQNNKRAIHGFADLNPCNDKSTLFSFAILRVNDEVTLMAFDFDMLKEG